MPRIAQGDYPRTPQDDSFATVAPKVAKAEAELSPSRSADGEYNRFRAFTPAPGAFLRTRHGIVKVSKALLGTEAGPPGVVISTAESCQVGFEGGSLHLIEVQPEGKKRMTGKDFANGLRLRPGDNLL
jgi:methionyl-tRNA formyltransferase